MAGSGIKEQRAALVLRRNLRIPDVLLCAAARIGHAALVLLVRGCGHVGDQKVDQPVIVHVSQIRAHRGIGRVRHHLIEDIGEGTIPIVAIELVGWCEIAAYIQVGPAVVIEIPPGGGVSLSLTGNPGPLGHVGEGAIAIVVKEVIPLALRMIHRVQYISHNENIEPAIPVIVAKGRHDGRILYVQSVGMGHFLEGPVALVDVEEIWGVPPADIDVQQAVVVHVDEGRSLLPDHRVRPVIPDSGLLRHILELEVAEISEEPAAFGFADNKDVRAAVSVVVADGHAGADRSAFEFAREFPPHLGVRIIVRGHEAGLLGGELHEHGLPAWCRPGCQRSSGDFIRRPRRRSRRPAEPDHGQQGTENRTHRAPLLLLPDEI